MVALDLQICLRVTVSFVDMQATWLPSKGGGPGKRTPQFPNSHITRVEKLLKVLPGMGEGLLGAQPPPQWQPCRHVPSPGAPLGSG